MAQLRRDKHRFAEAGAQVVLVGMGTPAESNSFAAKYEVPYPIVSDPGKLVYRSFDLKRMAPWDFLAPEVVLKGVSAMARGHLMGLPQGDVRQLPGVFVINTAGEIVFSHYAADAADHPAVADILDVVKAIR
ncbi:MAG: peroxiredoxin-like family protein [Desulfobacterales bacterium]